MKYIKRKLSIITSCLILTNYSNAAVTQLDFINLTTDLLSANNSLAIGGFTTADTVLSVTGAASGTDYIYSVNYTGESYDGDTTNDTLSFDIRVQAWSGGTITTDITGTTSPQTGGGTAVIGTTDTQVTLGSAGFAVNGATMAPNQSLEFSLQNFNVTTSTGSYTAQATGFTGFRYAEYNAGYGHYTMIGSSTSAADEVSIRWNNPNNSPTLDTNNDPLFISAANNAATGSAQNRWQTTNVKFGVEVVPEPSSTLMLGLSGLFLLRRHRA